MLLVIQASELHPQAGDLILLESPTARIVWSFGDGSTSNHPSPLHTYASEGSYTASLTVTDDDGLSDTVTMIIVVVDGGQGGCQ